MNLPRNMTSINMQNSEAKKEVDLTAFDPSQVKLLSEMVIVVDENDHHVGADSKKNCHLLENIKIGLLHRAFSVFLFNSKDELLLQQRSSAKITFPGHYTNTCCSHPLNIKNEIDVSNNVGVKNAAVRRLREELGITEIAPEDLTHLTRIHYQANSGPDGIWGEHEVDHILVVKKDVKVDPNPNEISDIKYFNEGELKQFLADADQNGVKISPWFKLISNTFLYAWWKNLNNLDRFQDSNIHRL